MDELLRDLYYSPETGLQSAAALYRKAKQINPNITQAIVNKFYLKQNVAQQFTQRHIRSQFPLRSYGVFEILQIDLLYTGNLVPAKNHNYKWIFVCIDRNTKYCFVKPLKDNDNDQCFNAMKDILEEIYDQFDAIPIQIDSDSESAFRSEQFQTLLADSGIKHNLSNVGDKSSVGIVERMNRTIRMLIEKYRTAHQSNIWSDVLDKLIYNYNHSFHRTIKCTPTEALTNGNYKYGLWQQNQVAKAQQAPFIKQGIQVGDQVRLKIKKLPFTKGTKPSFTRAVHTVEEIKEGRFYVSDRVNSYRKNELLKVDETENLPVDYERKYEDEDNGSDDLSDNDQDYEEEEKEEKKQNTINRRINKEGIERTEESLRRSGRQRKPNTQFERGKYGRVNTGYEPSGNK